MNDNENKSSLDVQVGGNHYRGFKIQPVEFCMANNLNFCQSSVIKYVCRYKNKNGVQDIDKAIHFLQILKQIEYPEPEKIEDPIKCIEWEGKYSKELEGIYGVDMVANDKGKSTEPYSLKILGIDIPIDSLIYIDKNKIINVELEK